MSRLSSHYPLRWLWVLLFPLGAAADDLIERFAALEAVWTSRISHDGKHVAIGCSNKGTRAACVYELDALGKPPRIYASGPEQRLEDLRWAAPGWLVLHTSQDTDLKAISDNLSLVRIDRLVANNIRTGEHSVLLEKDVAGQLNLIDVAATPLEWSKELLMRASTSNTWGAYRVDLTTGRGRVVDQFDALTIDAWFDTQGAKVLELRYDRKRDRYVVVRGKDRAEITLSFVPDEQRREYSPRWVGFTEGGAKLAAVAYTDNGIFQPFLFDTATGERLPADPALQDINIDGWISDAASDAVVGIRYTNDLPRQKFYDPALERTRLAVSKALAGQNVLITSWSADRSLISLAAAAPGMPETHYLFDRKQAALSPLGEARPQLAGLPVAATTSIKYAARDGLEIEAFVTLPAGKTAAQGPFPLIVMPHGGPLSRDGATFDWHAAYFAQRGFAVLRPNFRGSDGYGLEFRKKGYGEFGGAMIEDIIDGVRMVTSSGLADRNRVCAVGASYGGYAALMVGLRQPSLVKCVIAINAVTDPTAIFGERLKLFSHDSSVLAFWEEYIGSPHRAKAEVVAASPVRSAQHMRVPVLLLHSTADTTVPVGQSRHLKKEMELYGRTVRLVELQGADHYVNSAETRRVLLTESATFLTKYLGKLP